MKKSCSAATGLVGLFTGKAFEPDPNKPQERCIGRVCVTGKEVFAMMRAKGQEKVSNPTREDGKMVNSGGLVAGGKNNNQVSNPTREEGKFWAEGALDRF